MPKKFLQNFIITGKESRGFIVFLLIMVIIYIFPYLFENIITKKSKITIENIDSEKVHIDAYKYSTSNDNVFEDPINETTQDPVLFKFNPNNLPIELWMKLGLSEKQAKSIKNYELKGGKFNSKQDVKKMYVINSRLYQKLEPFIDIPSNESTEATGVKENISNFKYSKYQNRPIIELNGADSSALTGIKGIGPSFAARILKYKNRLGGFYKKEQLLEVWGIDSTKYQELENQISVDPQIIRKININTINFEEFKAFPYLSYKQMNAIINYRLQHGAYTNITDLKKIAIISQANVDKIAPYITLK